MDLKTFINLLNKEEDNLEFYRIHTEKIEVDDELDAIKLEDSLVMKHIAVILRSNSRNYNTQAYSQNSLNHAFEAGEERFLSPFVKIKNIEEPFILTNNEIILSKEQYQNLLVHPYYLTEIGNEEKRIFGLTKFEYEWLSGRERWNSMLEEKRNFIARLNYLEIRQVKKVKSLFKDTLDILLDYQDPNFLHEIDIKRKNDPSLNASHERLQRKLLSIYKNEPYHWSEIVSKYNSMIEDFSNQSNQNEFYSTEHSRLVKDFISQFIDDINSVLSLKSRFDLKENETDLVESIKDKFEQESKIEAEIESTDIEDYEYFTTKSCQFCGPNRHIFPLEVMNVSLLRKYMNTSGKILTRESTGLCKKHQKKVSKLIKYARHLNLFSYKKSEYRINDPFVPAITHGPILIMDDREGDPQFSEEIIKDRLREMRIQRKLQATRSKEAKKEINLLRKLALLENGSLAPSDETESIDVSANEILNKLKAFKRTNSGYLNSYLDVEEDEEDFPNVDGENVFDDFDPNEFRDEDEGSNEK